MAGPATLNQRNFSNQKGVNVAAGTAGTDAANYQQVLDAITTAESRANHTGTQTAATISDFDTQVRTSRLDQMALPTAPVSFNNQRNTNVADPTSAQDSATKAYVDGQISGLTSGQILKGAVVAATTVNVNISAPGATIDGQTPVSGTSIFILMGQSTGSQNGPWVWNGAAAAMTRPANFATSAQAVIGSYWVVEMGTYADTFALMTNDTTVTLGTTALTFIIRGSAAATTGYTTTCPAVSAGATWTVTHGLGSTKIVAQVARVASPFDFVDVMIQRPDSNTVYVIPDVALTSGQYEIMISKVA